MNPMLLWQITFWGALSGVAYIFVGYPVLIGLLARLRPAKRIKRFNSEPVSVVVVAHNEAQRLPAKIASILASDDQHRIREIVIASDGSTDDTASVLAELNEPRVKLVELPERRGKPTALNAVVPNCASEIVVLTDARQELDPRAIAELAANFADPRVGVVSGELVLKSEDQETTAALGIGAYWRYEKWIRNHEAQFRSVPGATGALYAVRRSLFRPIPPQTILDDVVIPMQAITSGARCVFEPAAIAFDQPSASIAQESIRKRRTIAGAAQLVLQHPAWLLPWRNPIWFEFISHKIARLASPLLLTLLAVANVMLVHEPLYGVLLTWQIAFYLSALAGWVFQQSGRRSALFGTQLMFVMLNATTTAALWDAARGRFQATWRRAAS
jgi:cellulose synthase/poly-beta-1,6-N-acetylglucosamine synthase-like glycosyltransferase